MQTIYIVFDCNDREVKRTTDKRYADIVCARFMGNYVLTN